SELLSRREQVAPLGLEEVDDVQILPGRLEEGSLTRQEMDMRVAAVPARRIHVDPAANRDPELALARLDRDPGADGLELETAGDVNDDGTAREPAFTLSVDVGVGH